MVPKTSISASADAKEKREHPRVSIHVQVSCVSINKDNFPLDQNKGYIIDVSQGGAAIEADSNFLSDRVAIVFNDNDHQAVGILGKVAYAKKTSKKTYLIGVSFQAEDKEKIEFVTKIVKFSTITKGRLLHNLTVFNQNSFRPLFALPFFQYRSVSRATIIFSQI